MTTEPRPASDAGDDGMERALDALGRAERAQAPAGLDGRIAGATASLLGGPRVHAAEGVGSGVSGRRRVAHTPGSRGAGHVRQRWALAAGLGAMACVAAWLALRPTASTTTPTPIADGPEGASSRSLLAMDPQAEVDALFAASSILGGDFDDEIDAISTTAASLGLSLTSPLDQDAVLGSLEGESL